MAKKEQSNYILISQLFDGKGGSTSLPESEISKEIKADNLAWVHFDVNDSRTKKWLEKEISYLDPFIVEALLADETRPRATEIGDGALVILRGVNLNKNADPDDMISIRMWIDSHRIITLQRRPVKSVLDLEEKLVHGKGPKDAGDFLCMLIERLFSYIEPTILELDDNTNEIEEAIIQDPDTKLREEIVEIRKKSIMFKRHLAPQREVISHLKLSDISWLNQIQKRQLQESNDHIIRYLEDIDAVRDRAQIIKDELANLLADKLNKNMYLLSVIAAIFLPLGFLTGLLGINVGGIPGAETPEAFAYFCIGLVILLILQILLFKKLKWF